MNLENAENSLSNVNILMVTNLAKKIMKLITINIHVYEFLNAYSCLNT